MAEISRAALFGRLNATSLKAIETATGFCKMRGNPYVELVHWLHVMLQDSRNDLAAIRSRFQLDDSRLARELTAALDALPRGATAVSDFSPAVEEAVEKGWLYASLQFSAGKVRTGPVALGPMDTASAEAAEPRREARARAMDVRFVSLKGSKVFHREDCSALKRAKTKERTVYTDRAAAEQARRPAEDCHP